MSNQPVFLDALEQSVQSDIALSEQLHACVMEFIRTENRYSDPNPRSFVVHGVSTYAYSPTDTREFGTLDVRAAWSSGPTYEDGTPQELLIGGNIEAAVAYTLRPSDGGYDLSLTGCFVSED